VLEDCGVNTEATRVTARQATSDDLPQILRLLTEAALPTEGVDVSLLLSTLVIVRAGEIIGSASIEVHGQVGLLRSVVITPEFRGQHFGEQLVNDRIEWARKRGITTLALFTEHAEIFFARLGFKKTTREQLPSKVHDSFEFGFCPSTSVSMILDLADQAER